MLLSNSYFGWRPLRKLFNDSPEGQKRIMLAMGLVIVIILLAVAFG